MTRTPANSPEAPLPPDSTDAEPILRIERIFSATRERVFRAWTEGELLRKWSVPEGLEAGEGWNELRVGGRFYLEMIVPDSGERFTAVGRYLEVEPPARLSMTHAWLQEGERPEDTDARATRVTVEFFDDGPSTRMVLTQRGFPGVESRDGHEEGWQSAFGKLDILLTTMESHP